MYNCQFCSSTFKHKSSLKRHLTQHLANASTEKEKDMIYQYIYTFDQIKGEKRFFCQVCDKSFTTEYSLDRHMQTSCNYKKLLNMIDKYGDTLSDDQINNIYSKLKKQQGSTHIENVNCTTANINNISNSNNNSNNTQINLNLSIVMNGGDENLEMLQNPMVIEEIKKIMEDKIFLRQIGHNKFQKRFNSESIEKALIKTFETINCNKEHPENHNLFVPDKSPYRPYYIYKDNQWKSSKDQQQLKDFIIHIKENLMKGLCRYNLDEFDEHINQLDGNFYETDKLLKNFVEIF